MIYKEIKPLDEFNKQLISAVHPTGWKNPTPDGVYNMVVIGGGSAGLISAIITASLGGKVALIERDMMGGDCLNVGCVPSKALIRSARYAHEQRNAHEYGYTPSEVSADDFPKVMERMRKIRAEISKNDSAERYASLGVDVYIGDAKYISRDSVEVGGQVLKFKKSVIATGARAVALDIEGLEDAGYLTNENIFDLEQLPKDLLVIGGGPIGCELAQAFSRFGSNVYIVQNDKFLQNEDADASAILEQQFACEGIKTFLYAGVTKVEKLASGRKQVLIKAENEHVIEVDEILIGVGRAPNVEGIGLEVAGVEYDARRGVIVDDNLRTTNKNIYAAGDCCLMWKFTHSADMAAQIVVQNALFMGRKKWSNIIMPWCTYTSPEIAHVGMYDKDAEKTGIAIDTFKFALDENDRALLDSESDGFVKISVQKGTDKIVGATIVAHHAGEMISMITMAMNNGLGLSKLGNFIYPYPTQADAIKRVATQYNKTKLTPLVAKLLKGWLGYTR